MLNFMSWIKEFTILNHKSSLYSRSVNKILICRQGLSFYSNEWAVIMAIAIIERETYLLSDNFCTKLAMSIPIDIMKISLLDIMITIA